MAISVRDPTTSPPPPEPVPPVAQTAFTALVEIQLSLLGSLREELDAMGAGGADAFPFDKLANVHFGRFVVLDPATDLDGNPIAPALYFAVDFDGPLDPFLVRLVEVAGTCLDRIFGHCVGYAATTPAQRVAFLRACAIPAGTVYVNWIGRTVQQIQLESDLRDQIEGFLDRSARELAGAKPTEVRAAVQRFVAAEPSLTWARTPLPPMSVGWRVWQAAQILLLAAGFVVLLPLIVLALPVFLIVLRAHEKADIPSTAVPSPATLDGLADLEDHVVQNPFSAVGVVKPGWFRRMTLTLVLFILNISTRFIFNRGSLSGVQTLHFARWVFIDDKKRLIFASSYDGSLESYMDDFINLVSWGLNAGFSNGVGYPRTNWLVFQGATAEQPFKNFLHNHQIATQVWYSAYPSLTVVNITNNASIRAGLWGHMDDPSAQNWLGLL
jgi:hypothetical protein